jgi:hypothetical protein
MDPVVRSGDSSCGTLLVLLAVVAVLVISGVFEKDTWKGTYYPSSGNLLNFTESPVFDSLDDCRNWVRTQVSQYNPDGFGYDYECGKNCKLKEGFTSLVCEETVQ